MKTLIGTCAIVSLGLLLPTSAEAAVSLPSYSHASATYSAPANEANVGIRLLVEKSTDSSSAKMIAVAVDREAARAERQARLEARRAERQARREARLARREERRANRAAPAPILGAGLAGFGAVAASMLGYGAWRRRKST